MKPKHFLALLSLALLGVSCASVNVPDSKMCGVAGSIVNGARCDYTLHDEPSRMTFDEFIAFLEPTESTGAAICMSAQDWNKVKTALEQACFLLKNRCSYSIKKAIASFGEKTARLSQSGDL